MNTLYLTGPTEGLPLRNVCAFRAAARWLRRDGFAVVSWVDSALAAGLDPTEAPAPEASELDAMREAVNLLVASWGVAFLPGTRHSPAALAEYEVARALGLQAFLVVTNPVDPGEYVLVEATYDRLDAWFSPRDPAHEPDSLHPLHVA